MSASRCSLSLKGRHFIQLAGVAGAWLFLIASPIQADEKSEVNELRERIEKLEKQNQELLEMLKGKQGVVPVSNREETHRDVRTMVSDILKEQEEKKKADEEAKKKQAAEEGTVVGSDLKLNATWNHGLQVETADKAFKIHVGGRTQIDSTWMSASDRLMYGPGGTGRIDDGVEFRRGRFLIEGQFYEVFSFACEYDFVNTFNSANANAGGTTANVTGPTDLWIQMNQLPIIEHVRVGNQKAPISFEHLTSSRWLNFIERSYAFDAFIGGLDNGFRPGIQAFGTILDDRIHWAGGVFKNNQTVFGFNVGDGEYDITGRLTGLPVYEAEGRCLVHVGVAVSHRDLDNDNVRFRARTPLRNGPAALHTRLLDITLGGDSQTLMVPEFVVVMGPWSLQAEYFGTWVNGSNFPAANKTSLGTTFYQSAYVEVQYFLTGEHRRYDKKYPRFDRVIPNENFFLVKDEEGGLAAGWGAWQIGVRYSWIDLNDNNINGGKAEDITVGLNWFWNPNSKWQFNYSYGRRSIPTGDSNGFVQGFGIRYAFDF